MNWSDLKKWHRSLRHELRSRWTVGIVLLHSVAVIVGLIQIMTADPNGILTAWRFALLLTDGPITSGAILVCVLCAVAVGAEFRFATVRQTVNWMGSRRLFAISKIVANSLSAIAVALLTLAINWLLLATVFGFRSLHFSVTGSDVVRLAGLVICFVWLWALLGSALALLVRSQALSVGIILGLFSLGEPLLSTWLGPTRSRWLPIEASRSALTWSHPDDPFRDDFGIEPATNIMYAMAPLVTMAAIVLILAWIGFMRRDL